MSKQYRLEIDPNILFGYIRDSYARAGLMKQVDSYRSQIMRFIRSVEQRQPNQRVITFLLYELLDGTSRPIVCCDSEIPGAASIEVSNLRLIGTIRATKRAGYNYTRTVRIPSTWTFYSSDLRNRKKKRTGKQ